MNKKELFKAIVIGLIIAVVISVIIVFFVQAK